MINLRHPMKDLYSYLCVSILLTCLMLLTGCQSEISLSTPTGVIVGNLQEQHMEFLGIPYANAPVNDLRWQPPVAKAPFSEPYSAQQFQAACPQFAQMNSVFNSNEDCLFLNIWRPINSADNLPVMVFLHGGGLATGAGSESRYNGQTLANNQNVIVVTINYRLGYLGYLSLPELTQEQGHSGNYGFLDQNLALKWVNKNIASFGGNPHQVTLFGESAGANSACLHLASPLSQDLFQNVILQSQGLYSSCVINLPSQQASEALGESFASIVNCQENTLQCLRDKSIFKLNLTLFAKGYKNGPIHTSNALPLRANIDNYFLTEQPLTTFRQGKLAHKNILMGVNKNEGTLFFTFDQDLENDHQYSLELKERYPLTYQKVAALYPLSGYSNANQAMADILGDKTFVCRSQQLAQHLAESGSQVYFYYFTQPVDSHMLPILSLFGGNGMTLGTFHASEIPYVFGVESIFGKLDEAAMNTSFVMQQLWGSFSYHNKPISLPSQPIWPLFEPATGSVLNLNSPLKIINGLKQEKCEFWNQPSA